MSHGPYFFHRNRQNGVRKSTKCHLATFKGQMFMIYLSDMVPSNKQVLKMKPDKSITSEKGKGNAE